jgi:peptidoglycan/xylan/chitin deacetylase (PgdA/CDA1 family)
MIWDQSNYIWPEGKNSAACFSVDVDANAPYLWQHRNKLPKTVAIADHRQYGMRVGLARIVKMLDSISIKGSFFVPGVVAEDNPDLLPGLIERGHEIALHGYYHELVGDISDQQFADSLGSAIELFKKQTGQEPAGFRSPAWEMTPFMFSELKRVGLWDSSLMGFDAPYTIDGVTEIPVFWNNDDAVYFKFLGPGDHMPAGDNEVITQWANDADAQARSGGLFMLTIHDWISGRSSRVARLEELFTKIREDLSVWITTCGELAKYHETLNKKLEVRLPSYLAVSQRSSSQR